LKLVEGRKMRFIILLIILLLGVLAAGDEATAQSWKEYSYPDDFFSVVFPAAPKIETTTYQVADDRSVRSRVYSVNQDGVLLKVTVAELANTGLPESAVIDHAIRMLSASSEVKFNIPHRIDAVYGRQLSLTGADGSRSMVALFDYKGRLYLIEGKAPPNASAAMVDAIRFQQSLIFTGGDSNRSPDVIRAIRQGCREVANPAGLDDPRCHERRN
jgi:hypothetical protein